MKKKVIIAISVILGLLILFMIFGGTKDDKKTVIEIKPTVGSFKVEVNTTGELEAANSKKIMGPAGLRMIRVWNVKISKLIPEGTVVDSGAWIASLDKTEATDKLKNVESELDVAQSKYNNTILDTTLDLRGLRDNKINLKFAFEEAKIKLEQSQYEPPATIRQAKINLQKAQRNYEQAIESYKVKVEQAKAKMKEVRINLDNTRRKKESIEKVLEDFEVTAPSPGMVIYRKNWRGNKIKEGDQISAWDPIVAELPDLSSMISKTYVNEIDISKVAVNQMVTIGVDAFPELEFQGKVISVANIGEQIPGGDAKVFEVKIKLLESDSLLKPAMTTSNSILIQSLDSVLHVPIEAVFSNDTASWVYKSSGLSVIKQEVNVGISNENNIIIKNGVDPDDKLLLSIPENEEKLELKTLAK